MAVTGVHHACTDCILSSAVAHSAHNPVVCVVITHSVTQQREGGQALAVPASGVSGAEIHSSNITGAHFLSEPLQSHAKAKPSHSGSHRNNTCVSPANTSPLQPVTVTRDICDTLCAPQHMVRLRQ